MNEEKAVFRRMNLLVYKAVFHKFWIMIVRHLSVNNLFCRQDHCPCSELSQDVKIL